MRLFLLLLMILATPVQALETAELIEQIRASEDLGPLFEALDAPALAARAGGDRRLAGALSRLREQLQAGQVTRVALAPEAAGHSLGLRFGPGRLNYLTLERNEAGALAGWYDHALGVHLHELVAALAALDADRAADLFKHLDRSPEQLLAQLEGDQPLARLLLAACAGRDCYPRALRHQRPLEPERASLWRYEQAVLNDDRDAAGRALERLREELGADPGLAWLEVARHLGQGDCQTALALAGQTLQKAPGYRPLYDPAVQCAVALGEHEQATELFRTLEERFGQRIDWQALEKQPQFRQYLDSESFRQWRGQ